MKHPKLALVIGSGGIKCAASIGLLKVLQEAGIAVDLLVGSSGGCLYAALIGLGHDAAEIHELTLHLWTPEVMKDYAANLKASQDGSIRFTETSGLVDDQVLNARVRAVLRDRTFADSNIPLKIVATDLYDGEKVVISEGSLFDAARASIAIPTVFPPWEVDGRWLTDGAASDPLPVDLAILEGAQVIVAMGFLMEHRRRMRSLTAVQLHLTNVYSNALLSASYAFHNLAHHAELIPIIPEFDGTLSMFDTDRMPYVIEQGERLARDQLPRIERILEGLG